MRRITNVLFLLVLTAFGTAIPRTNRDLYLNQNYFARTSQILATNLLKDNIDIDGNHVHSPLGISTVLAILAEGARGETYDEFTTALGFPTDKVNLRSAAKQVLQNFNLKDVSTTPAFKIWFYIYKNNTVNDEFKRILQDYYFAEVKDIDRSDYDWNEPQTYEPTNHNSKDIIGFETLKKSENIDDLRRDDNAFVALDDIDDKKEASKFDKVVDDKQYVEVPVIKEEIAKEKREKETAEKVNGSEKVEQLNDVKGDEVNDEDNETIRDEEKKEELKKDPDSVKPLTSNEPERISIPLKKLDDLEIMQNAESEFAGKKEHKGRTMLLKEDVTSALSANSIVGTDDERLTRILLFNGLYFRGSWLTPFQELRNGPEDVFFLSRDESMPTTMMRSFGEYKTARLDDFASEAIEFPYSDNRHSLLVLLPNDKEGLRGLIEKLDTDSITDIRTRLNSERVSVCLPKFNIESTSRSETTLKSLGLRRLFSAEDADLGNITQERKLHVDEIVQHVNIRVDEGSSSKDALTAGAEIRTADEDRSIVVNRPFLYFVLDKQSNLVIVLGKYMSPDLEEEAVFEQSTMEL